MATVNSRSGKSNFEVLDITGNPSTGDGVEAPAGSIAFDEAGAIYRKASSTATDWVEEFGGSTSPTFTGSVVITGTSSSLRLPNLTTAQRNLLTAAAGMVIFNTTTVDFEGYNGTIWVSLTA